MPVTIPQYYRAFFLWIEPISTLVGAYFAWFQPRHYLELTHSSSVPGRSGVPLGTEVVLRQLANLYFAFTLNEALVLRATNDVKIWKALLLGLLIADFGHLLSCFPLGTGYYYDVKNWNSIAWGNIAFVYCGAALRTCFLLDVGMGGGRKAKTRARKAIKATSDSAEAPKSAKASKAKSPAPTRRRRQSKAATSAE